MNQYKGGTELLIPLLNPQGVFPAGVPQSFDACYELGPNWAKGSCKGELLEQAAGQGLLGKPAARRSLHLRSLLVHVQLLKFMVKLRVKNNTVKPTTLTVPALLYMP